MVGYVHINKTGGTTIKYILRNSTWLRHCDLPTPYLDAVAEARDIAFAKKVFFFGLNSIAGHSLRPWVDDLPGPLDYFTILREPLKRCLSHYQHIKRASLRKGTDISFEEFMSNESYRDRQVRYIAGIPDVEKAKKILKERFLFVGMLENFNESMRILQKLLPFPITLHYRPRHVARDNSAKQEVLDNPDTLDLLHRGNRLDGQLYAFVRNELYPAYRQKAGIVAGEDSPQLPPAGYPIRYKLTRFYNQAIYRSLNKLRRRLQGV
jgi:hypothetical protein